MRLALERSASACAHALLASLTGLTVAGVLLAMAGWFEPVPVLVGATATAAAVFRLAAPARIGAPGEARWALVAVLVFIAAATALNARYAAQHVLIDRDPAVYNVTALRLAHEGELWLDPPGATLAGLPGIDAGHTGFGFYRGAPDGRQFAQFLHTLPALLAVADWIGGLWLLPKAPALLAGLALLMFFAFASRLVAPWAALAATVTLGVTLPFTYFARDTYSEPLAIALLMGGLWLLSLARERLAARQAFAAGLVLGATCMVRIDSLLYLAPLLLYLAYELSAAGAAPPQRRRAVARFAEAVAAGLALTVALGLLDGLLFSRPYLEDLGAQLGRIALAVGTAAVAGAAAVALRRRIHTARERLAPAVPAMANGVAALVVVLGALAYFVRPEVSKSFASEAPWQAEIAALQALEGVPIEPLRTYDEASMVWLGWYLGPFVLAGGVVGAALLARRVLLRGDKRLVPFLLILGSTALVYLWSPSITPDHIWASRRFLPVVIPGLVLCAYWLLDRAWRRVDTRRRRTPAAIVALAIAVAAMTGAAARRTTVIATQSGPQTPLAYAVEDLCERLPPDAVVALRSDGNLANHLPQTLHAVCGVAVGVPPAQADIAYYRELAAGLGDRGRRLFVLSALEHPFGTGPGIPPSRPALYVMSRRLERTLTRPPEALLPETFALSMTEVSAAR